MLPSRGQASQQPSTTASGGNNQRPHQEVRRNLFHSSLSRRAPSKAPSTAAGASVADGLPQAQGTGDDPFGSFPTREPTIMERHEAAAATDQDSDNDIVTFEDGGLSEMPELDGPAWAAMLKEEFAHEGEVDTDLDGEDVNDRLIDMYRGHSRQHGVHQAELYAAIQASLQAKVASLEEDRWMYEVEEHGEVSGHG